MVRAGSESEALILAVRLKLARLVTRVSVEALERRSGVSADTIRSTEAKRRTPGPATLATLARALGFAPEAMVPMEHVDGVWIPRDVTQAEIDLAARKMPLRWDGDAASEIDRILARPDVHDPRSWRVQTCAHCHGRGVHAVAKSSHAPRTTRPSPSRRSTAAANLPRTKGPTSP